MEDLRIAVYRNMVFLLGFHLSRYDEAEWFANAARRLGKRLDVATADQADLLLNLAAITDRRGTYDKELDLADEALALREQAGLPHDTRHALALGYRGNALYNLGRYEEALGPYRESLKITEERVGRVHPSTAGCYENVGNALRGVGDLEGALEAQQTSVSLLEQVGEQAEHRLGNALNNLGTVLSDLERHEEAADVFQRAGTIIAKTHEGSPAHGVTLLNEGEARLRSGDVDRALALCKDSLEILESTMGPDHMFVGTALAVCGHANVENGDDHKALEILNRSRKILAAEGADPLSRAEAELWWAMATARLHPDRMEEVRIAIERSRTALQTIAPRGAGSLQSLEAWASEHLSDGAGRADAVESGAHDPAGKAGSLPAGKQAP
jgi:tetratricopeptide (TPR) repeat protein